MGKSIMPRIDSRLADHARSMRREPTRFEARLWRALSGSKLAGLKFRRQAAIEGVIVDFFCPAIGLVVEVDGGTHDPVRDVRRDAMLGQLGFKVLRFSNEQVADQLDAVLRAIAHEAARRPPRWPGRLPTRWPAAACGSGEELGVGESDDDSGMGESDDSQTDHD